MSALDNALSGDVFNARDLSATQIAKRFIAPAAFKRLLKESHCVLEGPRGSGKTTLLRMLTPEAFALWADQNAQPTIPFIGVFVPADVRWAKQMNTRLIRITDSLTREVIQQAIFSVAVNIAFIDTIEKCSTLASQYSEKYPSLFFEISRVNQANAVNVLSELWQLEVPVPSFNGIRLALRKRQLALGNIALMLAGGGDFADIQRSHAFLSSTWLDNLVTAVESINDVFDRPNQSWALLLDELEIIQPDLLTSIVGALRSTSPKLRFKLAMSPTGSDLIPTTDQGNPTGDNDFRPIRLWYDNRKQGREFAEKLFLSALVERGCAQSDQALSDLLTESVDQEEYDEQPVAADLSKDTSQKDRIAIFSRLYEKDESFKLLLDTRNIDPKEPPISDSQQHGSWVRKITPIARHRDLEVDQFAIATGKAKKKGGHKGYQSYIGHPNLIDLAEANPRWVLTLAEAVAAQSEDSSQRVSTRTVQGAAIRNFVENFVAKLKVYPTGPSTSTRRWTTFQFIASLADAISSSIYDGPFNTDPAMSFTIDARALQQYGEYIQTCIDLGALVIMRSGGPSSDLSTPDVCGLLGSRVRLSYRLAPHFRLPLRSIKEQALSSALKAGALLDIDNSSRSVLSSKESNQDIFLPIQPRLI